MTGSDLFSVFLDWIAVTNYSARQFMYDRNPVSYEEIKGNRREPYLPDRSAREGKLRHD